MAGHSPDPIDVAVGARIRQRRKALGLSQQKVAEACGVTFQQQQKRERGTNRISASQLVLTSRILNCAPADLLPPEGEPVEGDVMKALGVSGAPDLVEAFAKVPADQRQAIVGLVRSIAQAA